LTNAVECATILKKLCPTPFEGWMAVHEAWMRLPEAGWRLPSNPGGSNPEDDGSGRKMTPPEGRMHLCEVG
jgi:hypothetical protein